MSLDNHTINRKKWRKTLWKVSLLKTSVKQIVDNFLYLDFKELIKKENPNNLLEIIKAIEFLYENQHNLKYEKILSEMWDIFKYFVNNNSLNKEVIDKFLLSNFFRDLLEKEILNSDEEYLDNLIKLTKNIHLSNEAEGIIMLYLVKKYRDSNNNFYKEQLQNIHKNHILKQEEINKNWHQIIEDIKQIYTWWNDFNSLQKPTNSWWNFVKNLKQIWLSIKWLNISVPKDYKKNYNEILIYNKNLWNYQVFVWNSDYSWIKHLNIEELTWKNFISIDNPLLKDINELTEKIWGYDWRMLFDILSQDNNFLNINIKLFFSFLREYYTNKWLNYDDFIKRFEENIWIVNILNFPKFDVSENISNYLEKNFNWEFTKQEYLDFWKKFNSILNQKIQDLIKYLIENKKKKIFLNQ